MVCKALWQLLALLLCMLLWLPSPDIILLQVPPAVPILAVCTIIARLRHARLIIDWHNFGYTLMALQMGSRHPLVLLARRFEKGWGRQAHAHLCVTKAMQAELQHGWGIQATVFYDRCVVGSDIALGNLVKQATDAVSASDGGRDARAHGRHGRRAADPNAPT